MKFGLFLVTLFMSSSVWAYYSTLDTGDILDEGAYRLQAQSQFITDNDSGVNLIGNIDRRLTEEMNLRGVLGFGATDFQVGGFVKWVPYPDFENQPAIGFLAGLLYARNEGFNELSLRFHPLVSKKFELEIGELTPYATLPIGLRSLDGKLDLPIQLELGSRYVHPELPNTHFYAEIGFNMREAFTYFSLGASFYIDEEEGFIQ